MKECVIEKNNLRVIRFESMTRIPFIEHCFTTKTNNLGKDGFAYLRGNDDLARLSYEALGLKGYSVAFSRQSHTNHVAVLKTVADVNALNESNLAVDGLVTDLVNVALFTVYADCTPIYAIDLKKRVIGLAHSGWKGTLAQIGPEMVKQMQIHYGTELQDLCITLGPSISEEAFEVGEDVSDAFCKAFGVEEILYTGYEKPHIHVRHAIKKSLMNYGLQSEQIHLSDSCTYRDNHLFYSHRRDGQPTGRMAAILVRKE